MQVLHKVYRFEGYALDVTRGCLRTENGEVELRPKSFDVLRYLLENAERLVSKEELLKSVWPKVIVTEDSLTRCVSEVRRALGDDDHRLIKTVPGRGYVFATAVLPPAVDVSPASSVTTAAAARPGLQTEAAQALILPDKPSIAVLPFNNMSGDPEQEYFADGIVEEIITALSRMRWLFVIARNSSFIYKGRAVDVKQVGRELGVRYVLEGGVRRAADRVRITAQLIDATTGMHLWADRFEGALGDIFDLQDQVTVSVVGAIAPKLERAEIERAKHKPTESLDAYDHYLRAMASLHRATRESNRKASEEALQLCYRAIELDPEFSSAYGLAALCYCPRKQNGWMADRAQETAEAERLARRVAELGHDDALALCRAGYALAYLVYDLDAGAALIERALALNPNLALAWRLGGWVKIYLGEPESAIEYFARMIRQSPRDPSIFLTYHGISFAHFCAGRYDDASAWAEKELGEAPNCAPALRVAAASHALAGRLERAQKAMARMRELDSAYRISNVKDRTPLRRPDDLARYEEGLQKAGLPE
jgi:TolB-like protein/tetratricopeptide (TPR) repeat protein